MFSIYELISDISQISIKDPSDLHEIKEKNCFVTLRPLYGQLLAELNNTSNKIVGPSEIEFLSIRGKGSVVISNVFVSTVDIKFEGKIYFENCNISNITSSNGTFELRNCKIRTFHSAKDNIKLMNCACESFYSSESFFEFFGCSLESDVIFTGNSDKINIYNCRLEGLKIFDNLVEVYFFGSFVKCDLVFPEPPSRFTSLNTVIVGSVCPPQSNTKYLFEEKVYILQKDQSGIVDKIYLPSNRECGACVTIRNETSTSIIVIVSGKDTYRLGGQSSALYVYMGNDKWTVFQ